MCWWSLRENGWFADDWCWFLGYNEQVIIWFMWATSLALWNVCKCSRTFSSRTLNEALGKEASVLYTTTASKHHHLPIWLLVWRTLTSCSEMDKNSAKISYKWGSEEEHVRVNKVTMHLLVVVVEVETRTRWGHFLCKRQSITIFVLALLFELITFSVWWFLHYCL